MSRIYDKRINKLEQRAGLARPNVVHISYSPTKPDDLSNKMKRANNQYPGIPFFAIPSQCATVEQWVNETANARDQLDNSAQQLEALHNSKLTDEVPDNA